MIILFSTKGPYTKMEKLLKRLMEHFNWKRVAIIASTDDIWQIAANLVKIELVRHGINVAHFHSFIPGRLHILESRIVRHADLIRKAANRAMSKYSGQKQREFFIWRGSAPRSKPYPFI